MHFSNPFASVTGYNISLDERDKYSKIFQEADSGNAGFLTGEQVKEIIMRSGLPNKILAQIWFLANFHCHGYIDLEKFSFAMHLIYLVRQGLSIDKFYQVADSKTFLKLKKLLIERKDFLDQVEKLKRNINENIKVFKQNELTKTIIKDEIQKHLSSIKDRRMSVNAMQQQICDNCTLITILQNLLEIYQLKSNFSKQQSLQLKNYLDDPDSKFVELISILSEKKKQMAQLFDEFKALQILLLRKDLEDGSEWNLNFDFNFSTNLKCQKIKTENIYNAFDFKCHCSESIDLSTRKASINELVQSEEAYVNDLLIIFEVFYNSMKQEIAFNEKELDEIFMNLSDILSGSKNFLRDLKHRLSRYKQECAEFSVGDVIYENLQQMDPYIAFCSFQHRRSILLQDKLESDSKFKELYKNLCHHQKASGMSLCSFLLKPIQRITRYPLIIEKILKSTPCEFKDYKLLDMAKNKAVELCNIINEASRMQQNSDYLNIIQRRVQCDDGHERLIFNSETNCLGHRKYLHSGLLYKVKNSKELMGLLFTDLLLLTLPSKPIGFASSILSSDIKPNTFFKVYESPIPLNEISISTNLDDQISFRITYKGKTLHLRAPNSVERDSWIKAVDSASRNYAEFERLKKSSSDTLRSKKPIGRLLVCIHEGTNLVNTEGEFLYCEVTLGEQEYKSKLVPGNANPKWNASMQFSLYDIEEDILHVEVYAKREFSKNVSLGWAKFVICDIVEAIKKSREPITKHLSLNEVESGELIIKLDLQLYINQR